MKKKKWLVVRKIRYLKNRSTCLLPPLYHPLPPLSLLLFLRSMRWCRNAGITTRVHGRPSRSWPCVSTCSGTARRFRETPQVPPLPLFTKRLLHSLGCQRVSCWRQRENTAVVCHCVARDSTEKSNLLSRDLYQARSHFFTVVVSAGAEICQIRAKFTVIFRMPWNNIEPFWT